MRNENRSSKDEGAVTRPIWFKRTLVVDKESQRAFIVMMFAVIVLFNTFSVIGALVWRYFIEDAVMNGSNGSMQILFGGLILFACGIILGGIAAFLCNVYTNRIFGPIRRRHDDMKRALAGESHRPLSFRKADRFSDVAETYNQLMAKQNASGASPQKSASSE